MLMHVLWPLRPILAYGWYWGWWWWWWVILIFFFWWLLLPPFGWGRRWYGTYRSRYGTPVPGAPAGMVPDESGYAVQWHSIESEFIESPGKAVADADRLVSELLAERGRPQAYAQQYADAHAIALKNQRGEATPEELRAAMLAYRTVFEQLTQLRG